MKKSLVAILVLISMVIPTFTSSAAATSWSLPFESDAVLVNQYRQPSSEYSAGHRGVDYLVSLNQVILAPADGQVRFKGVVVDRPLLTLTHPNGELTEFEPLCSDLSTGDLVRRLEPIGWVCDAAPNYRQHCEKERCLHFSLRKNDWYLSPLALIGGLNPSRLLPN